MYGLWDDLTLSPQIVLLATVLSVNAAFRMKRQIVVSLIVRQNLVSGSKDVGLGIWNRSKFALNLYG